MLNECLFENLIVSLLYDVFRSDGGRQYAKSNGRSISAIADSWDCKFRHSLWEQHPQLGEVVSDIKMTNLSLNGRSYTDLLAIQPGIAPTTTMKPNSVIMAGVTGTIAPSGELSAGNVSISGQRESANGFLVNGSDVQEHMNGGTGVVPNLDSISEFRVLTNNFDPEYGNYNGGIVNVVTKSGSNMFHGNVFEFL